MVPFVFTTRENPDCSANAAVSSVLPLSTSTDSTTQPAGTLIPSRLRLSRPKFPDSLYATTTTEMVFTDLRMTVAG